MNSSDLAFFTTDELIEEILRRKTFLGVVVHSERELREAVWENGAQLFQIRHNANLDAGEAVQLLRVVAGKAAPDCR